MKKNLFKSIFLCIFAAVLTGCTLFKVVTGRVEYKDPNHEFTTSVDTLVIEKYHEYVK